jgi:translation initiation factor 2 beta subunit (eIF-2beta)/eIF-5
MSQLQTSGKVNIGRDNSDSHYRYKRNMVEIKVENKNGGQTRITNLDTICSQIKSGKDEIVKFIQKALSVPIKDDTLRGEIDASKIEVTINLYIDKYILCPSKNCKLPEYHNGVCKACGYCNVEPLLEKTSKITIEDDKSDYYTLWIDSRKKVYVSHYDDSSYEKVK